MEDLLLELLLPGSYSGVTKVIGVSKGMIVLEGIRSKRVFEIIRTKSTDPRSITSEVAIYNGMNCYLSKPHITKIVVDTRWWKPNQIWYLLDPNDNFKIKKLEITFRRGDVVFYKNLTDGGNEEYFDANSMFTRWMAPEHYFINEAYIDWLFCIEHVDPNADKVPINFHVVPNRMAIPKEYIQYDYCYQYKYHG